MNSLLQGLESRIVDPIKQTVQKAVIAAIVASVALIFIIIALVFFSLAGYKRLCDTQDPDNAALIVGGVLVGLAILAALVMFVALKSGKKKQPEAVTSNAQTTASSLMPFRTGYPMIDLAQLAFPLIRPLSGVVQQRVKAQPLASAAITLAAGAVSGLLLFNRHRIPFSISKPKR